MLEGRAAGPVTSTLSSFAPHLLFLRFFVAETKVNTLGVQTFNKRQETFVRLKIVKFTTFNFTNLRGKIFFYQSSPG